MPSEHKNNQLDQRESVLFKRILKCYEQKQYKNGLKFAKQILSNSKFSEHGETLAMKGLILNCVGKKEEAWENVKRGLKNDVRSYVCWHVYGLLQRSERKYDEAIKAYRNALKLDKDNLQILRDLSLLQIQLRDLEGYKETRCRLLNLRPVQRASWIGYAISHHLLNNYDMAFQVLDEFRKTTGEIKPFDYEHNEMLLYMNTILQEAGKHEEALKFLDDYDSEICDRLSVDEYKANLLILLDRKAEAADIFRSLIERNPDNKAYYLQLEDCAGLVTIEQKLEMYSEYASKFSRAAAPRLLPLSFLSGDSFRIHLDQYLRPNLSKGVPPLFMTIKDLCYDKEKCELIKETVEHYIQSLTSSNKFSPEDKEKENPTTLVWASYLLSLIYDISGDSAKGLDLIERQIQAVPTVIELHETKGRIYKHAGDIFAAVHCLDEAQSLDTADRFVNSKCARYLLQANLIDEAEAMCSKFTRENHSAMDNLTEMQCNWFLTECAYAYFRRGELGQALKKCHEIDRHFTEITEDQFDFHTYCLRKMTLRSYISLLRLEDALRSHRFFFRAAELAVRIYIQLHDSPPSSEMNGDAVSNSSLSSAEQKKLRNKQRKARKKAEKDQQEKRLQEQQSKNKVPPKNEADAESPSKNDLKPDELLKTTEPLEQATIFLQPLKTMCRNNIQTQILAFELYQRKGKILLMAQAVKRGRNIDEDCPELHKCTIRFLIAVRKFSSGDDVIRSVLDRKVKAIFHSEIPPTPEQWNKDFLHKHSNSLPHVYAGAQMLYFLNDKSRIEAIELATCFSDEASGVTIKLCGDILMNLKNKNGTFGGCAPEKLIEAFRSACELRFPLALAFKSEAVRKEYNKNNNAETMRLRKIESELTAAAASNCDLNEVSVCHGNNGHIGQNEKDYSPADADVDITAQKLNDISVTNTDCAAEVMDNYVIENCSS